MNISSRPFFIAIPLAAYTVTYDTSYFGFAQWLHIYVAVQAGADLVVNITDHWGTIKSFPVTTAQPLVIKHTVAQRIQILCGAGSTYQATFSWPEELTSMTAVGA